MTDVSIIMGVYNCKNPDQLKKSVRSIINQTYTNWEFIICDDGSTIYMKSCLDEILLMDSRIKIIGYEKNKGLSYALNQCIAISKGKYIARQDDDDESFPERLEKQVEFLNSNPQYSIVGTMAETFDTSGKQGIYNVPPIPVEKDFRWNSPFIHPTVMMRKKDLEDVGNYRVSSDTVRGQDYDLFMRMYAHGYKGYNIQETLYKYQLVNGGYKKRPLKIRISEAKVRANGFWNMGIFYSSIPYILKPIILGMIPVRMLNKLRERFK